MSDEPDLAANEVSEPLDADTAFGIRERHADDPHRAVILMPTLEDMERTGAALGGDPEQHLALIRLLNDGLADGALKAISHDIDDDTNGHWLATFGITTENALVDLYGSQPRLLARLLVQHNIDGALAAVLPVDDGEEGPQ